MSPVGDAPRCPTCGARNAETARWCTQCFAALELAGGAPDPRSSSVAEAPVSLPDRVSSQGLPDRVSSQGLPDRVSSQGPPDRAASPDPSGAASRERDIREREGVVQWRCTSCSSWADLADAACPTCGAPRRGFGDAHDSATTSRTIDRATARVAAVALPGLGHMLAGRHAAGIARAVLGLLWLLGGLTLTVGAAPGTARVPGLVLLLGAAVLWVAAALDVDALVRGGADAVLTGRRLLWLVVGVTGGLVLATVGAIAGGTSSVVG